MEAPRIEYWKNKKGEYNYHIIARNGKVLISVNQGFKRKAGLLKNIQAVWTFFQHTHNPLIEVK